MNTPIRIKLLTVLQIYLSNRFSIVIFTYLRVRPGRPSDTEPVLLLEQFRNKSLLYESLIAFAQQRELQKDFKRKSLLK